MKFNSIHIATLFALSSSLVACIYSSDPPAPFSSGNTDVSQSTDDTDPGDAGAAGATGTGSTGTGSTGTGSTGTGSTGTGSTGTGTTAKDGGSTGTGTGSTTVDSGTGAGTGTGTGTGTTSTAPTYSALYTAYFSSTGAGECAKSGCHSSSKGGFKCGTTAATCYAGMVTAGLIDSTSPASSEIISKTKSPVEWFGGNMPSSGGTNAQAVTDITAWVNAGALNN